MTSRPPPKKPLNPQKGNIMSIIRHEIRQISEENRGQPIISQAVVHGNVAYFAGITPNPIVGDIKTQTAQVLRRVDELLNLAGTDKSQLLSAQVWIADMRLFEDHNSVWNDWVDPANPRRGLASRPVFGDLGCSLKLWWLRPCHDRDRFFEGRAVPSTIRRTSSQASRRTSRTLNVQKAA